MLLEVLTLVSGLAFVFFGWGIFRAFLALWGALLGAAGAGALAALLDFGTTGIVLMALVGAVAGGILAYAMMVVALVFQCLALGFVCSWLWGGGLSGETRALAGLMIGGGFALLAVFWHRTLFTFYLALVGGLGAVTAALSLATRDWPPLGDPAWSQLLLQQPLPPETLPPPWACGLGLGLALVGTFLQRGTDPEERGKR